MQPFAVDQSKVVVRMNLSQHQSWQQKHEMGMGQKH